MLCCRVAELMPENLMTDLQRAFIQYLEYHIWPSLREPGLEGFPYHRAPQV
jgi:hypothetical protein